MTVAPRRKASSAGLASSRTRDRSGLQLALSCRLPHGLLLAACCFCLTCHTAMAAQPLLLSQALRYALQHSPSITSAKSSITSAQAQKLAAIAALLPRISLTEEPQIFTPVAGSGSSVIGGVVVPSGHGYNANVASANLSLDLFSGGKGIATLRASLAGLNSADLALTATLDTLFDQLLTSFAAVSVDQITLRNEAQMVRLNSDLVVLTNLRLHGRVASQLDVIQAQQQLLQARLQLIQARQQVVSDLEKVYTDMGLPDTAGAATVEEWLPTAPSPIPEQAPVAEDPSVTSAREALASAQEKVTAARADYYPTVSLVGQYNYLGIDPSSMGLALRATRSNNYSFGIEVTVPVLPLFNVQSEVDTADAGVQNAQGQYRGALVTAANRVSDAAERFREAQRALHIATRSDELARQNLRLVQDRYAARQASLADVDNARLLAIQANESLAIARIEFRLAGWKRYRSLDGKEFPAALLAVVARQRHP
jgi:outer membrane protein TolC